MTISLNNRFISLTCPHCGKEFKEQIGRVKRDRAASCPACKQRIAVEAHKITEVEKTIQKELNALGKSLRINIKL